MQDMRIIIALVNVCVVTESFYLNLINFADMKLLNFKVLISSFSEEIRW